jgi:hypothetical protein
MAKQPRLYLTKSSMLLRHHNPGCGALHEIVFRAPQAHDKFWVRRTRLLTMGDGCHSIGNDRVRTESS